MQAVYSGAGRDFESIGLAWSSLDPASALPAAAGMLEDLVRRGRRIGSVRILGDMRRFPGTGWGVQDAACAARKYWEAVARAARHRT